MKVVLAAYGSRGDTEPFAAVGRELLRRGHDVCMAVAPSMVGLVELAGLAAVPFGPESLASSRSQSPQDPVVAVVTQVDELDPKRVERPYADEVKQRNIALAVGAVEAALPYRGVDLARTGERDWKFHTTALTGQPGQSARWGR